MKQIVDPKNCKVCEIGQRMQPNTVRVPGYGNPSADIMLIGEGPGKTEAYSGFPFVGEAGTDLDKMLRLANIDREDLFISNLIRCWPYAWKEHKKTKDKYLTNRTPSADESKNCFKYLSQEIEIVNPKVIVSLGGAALSFLEGKKQSIMQRKGIPSLYGSGIKKRTYIYPTLHPSFVSHNGGVTRSDGTVTPSAAEVIKHLKEAVTIAKDEALFQEHQYMIVDSRAKAEKVLQVVRDRKVITFDIEAEGLELEDRILGVGIGVGVGVACYFPFLVREMFSDTLVNFWENKDISELEVLSILKTIFGDKNIKKSAHSAKFDKRGLRKQLGIEVENVSWDSMCSSYLLDENTSHKLDDLKNKYLDLVGYSDKWNKETNFGKKAANASLDTIAYYCCGDCDATYRLTKDHMETFQDKPQFMNLMQNFYVPLTDVLSDMEYDGVAYDISTAKELSNEYLNKAQKLKADIVRYAGVPFDVDSNDEVAKVLFNKLKLKHDKRTKGQAQSTDKSVLEDLAKEHIVPKLIIDYRHVTKMKSTYMDRLIKNASSDGRVHLPFNITGTVTGRLSSKGLQNIPKDVSIKSLLIAPEGYKLVQADESQVEVRCFAHFANEETLRAAFAQEGIDVHSMVASEIMGKPYEEFLYKYKVEKDPEYDYMRSAAKAVAFGILYGRGADSIAAELGISIKEAEAFIVRFFGRLPKCKAWIDTVHKNVLDAGEVQNIFGRVRRLPAIYASDKKARSEALRQSVNSIIQSTAADITGFGIIGVYRHLKENKIPAKLVLTVHDSVVVETRDDYVDYVSKLLVDVMEKKPHPDFTVKLRADIDVYQKWGLKMAA